jgi:hypothetical protein
LVALNNINGKVFDVDDFRVLGIARQKEVVEFLARFFECGGEVVPRDHGLIIYELFLEPVDVFSPFLGFGEQPFVFQYFKGKLDLAFGEASFFTELLLRGYGRTVVEVSVGFNGTVDRPGIHTNLRHRALLEHLAEEGEEGGVYVHQKGGRGAVSLPSSKGEHSNHTIFTAHLPRNSVASSQEAYNTL